MAFPFLTTKPMRCLLGTTTLTYSVTTDPAHATDCDFRITVYSDAGKTVQVGQNANGSSAGLVQERLAAHITGLTAGTTYYIKAEYDELKGAGAWVEITGMPSVRTAPAATGTGTICITSDPHLDTTDIDTDSAKALRYDNAVTVLTADAPDLWISGGDEHLAPHADAAAATDYGTKRRNRYATAHMTTPFILMRGNWEHVDGSGDAADLVHRNGLLQFFFNPNSDDLLEGYGKTNVGPAKVIYVEPYTQSGFPITPPLGDYDAQVSATQLTFVTDEIASNDKRWLILHCHQALVNRDYRVGNGNVLQDGSQANTIHAALVAHLAANPGRGALVIRGHDHVFGHDIIDGIHYVQVGSPSAFFALSTFAEDVGYWLDADGTLPSSTKFLQIFPGYMRIVAAPHYLRGEFIRTTTVHTGTTADDTLMYAFTIPGVGNHGEHWAGTSGVSTTHWLGLNW